MTGEGELEAEVGELRPHGEQLYFEHPATEVLREHREYVIDARRRRRPYRLVLVLMRCLADLASEAVILPNEISVNKTQFIARLVVGQVEDAIEFHRDFPKLSRQEVSDVESLALCLLRELGDDARFREAQVENGEAVRRIEATTETPCPFSTSWVEALRLVSVRGGV